MPEYFLILVGLFIGTFFLHHFSKVRIYQSTVHLVLFNSIMLGIAIIWDQFAISRGHWSFNNEFLLGIRIGYMPIEEFLFAVTVGYLGLVIFKILERQEV